MKTSNKNYFKGLIIGCGGAILVGNGIYLLAKAVQQAVAMVTKQGYIIVDALSHTFGDVFGLILFAVGVIIICEGVRKSRS